MERPLEKKLLPDIGEEAGSIRFFRASPGAVLEYLLPLNG